MDKWGSQPPGFPVKMEEIRNLQATKEKDKGESTQEEETHTVFAFKTPDFYLVSMEEELSKWGKLRESTGVDFKSLPIPRWRRD